MNTVQQRAHRAGHAPAPRARVVIAKPGLDGHDRGAKVIARALRDAGYEVIYTGLHQTPEQIVATVIAEDAPLLGLSVLSGAHLTIVERVLQLLAEEDAGDVRILVGGIIPDADIAALEALGVHAVFTPGAGIGGTVDRLLTTTDTTAITETTDPALEPAC
ncbi:MULTISPECIES: cobalamin B12-binding domain-containing protein [unclassified Streptomyces]|uniref:Cobalamin B12-binding domain-containing protein n=1 Tax=Streptomyces sp. NBC_00119 TaxID=2975659 RepID=A0AAU1UJZ3_9ACTN|nr:MULTISPECIES: cobalamin B12-binding domain-containing protein [unclassified Streptomyces]MCX4650116.1 cobalamin B12-binding domain-containing protein [Streptomyces sp. NBC_01446]MCX5320665.1 cobalamin B12-binding domain-containing protein [Streptomyces sp. NBC_00120]